jgi:arylsulfatase
MKNKTSNIFLLFILLLPFLGCQPEKPQLPNIVIIFIDDQGYADLGCYGAEGFETPNIDKLATEGKKFTNFYVSEAVCSASRSSLLTGCYAQRVSIRGALSALSFSGLNQEETTIASMLKQKDYKTAIYGKWHLGHHPEFLPNNFGFDEYFGLPYSNDMWPVDYNGKTISEGYKGLYPELYLIKDDKPFQKITNLKQQEPLTTMYTKKAVDFINRNADNPFFLYIPHSMVHVPLAVSDKYKGKSKQGMYGDVMMEIDWSVGEVVKALEENGIDDNTLIIYTSDNGPWLNFGNHGGSAFPLREGKGTAWEGGVRVPCIMKWADEIEANTTTDELVTSLDILPTIAAITNTTLPEKKIDGINMLPFLRGEIAESPRDEFYYYYQGELCGVRKGDWKLVLPHKYRSYVGVEPGKDGWPGPYARGESGLELYNLKDDISEKNDVADLHPEIVAEINKIVNEARRTLGDDILDMEGSEVRPCGRVGGVDSIQNSAIGKTIELKTQPVKRYDGSGPNTLIDGVLGSFDFHDGRWLGFREKNVEFTIDLGELVDVKHISARFLLNQTSWIFLPGMFEISVSQDNKKFETIFRNFYENQKQDLKVDVRQIGLNTDVKTRFIKLKADAIGVLPEWHPGHDDKGWLFVDEVVIN